MKVCNRCTKEKPLSEFNKNKHKNDGHNGTCRDCMKLLLKEHYLGNKSSYLKRNNKNRILKLESLAGRPRPNVCEVCGRGGKICWDHDHATGKFRGWLCSSCNLTLGKMDDNPDFLYKLAKYLENNRV